MINLGDKVRDSLTGFTGIVIGRCEYLTGCNQLLVQPPCKESGDFVESRWLDLDRLMVTETAGGAVVNVTAPGRDKAAPRK
jgi:hypothetical protein